MFTMHKDSKPFALGALAGAALVLWLGFGALDWKTPGKAEALAKQHASNVVVAAYANICAAQINGAKDASVRLAKLQSTERWSRGDVIAKAGWATMYGAKEPAQGVSQACADLLFPEKP